MYKHCNKYILPFSCHSVPQRLILTHSTAIANSEETLNSGRNHSMQLKLVLWGEMYNPQYIVIRHLYRTQVFIGLCISCIQFSIYTMVGDPTDTHNCPMTACITTV